MSCSTRTRSTESYSQKLSTYLASVWSTYNPIRQPLSSWAKSSAKTFVSTASTTTPMHTVISDITTYAENQPAPRQRRSTTSLSLAAVDSLESQFARTFAHEYDTWYDAFVEEAREDPQGPSADDRWTLFVAKKLQRKTQHDLAHLSAAVAAWLLLTRA